MTSVEYLMSKKITPVIKVVEGSNKAEAFVTMTIEQFEEYGKHCTEKPLLTDEQMKERGNLTCRVMLRQLNCKHERNNVTMSMKELEHWFETGQHLKEWKEWDTI